MLIPSIDLMGGRIVQLVQGKELKLVFDDFEHWIHRFSSYPMVQLIDLDAAMRQGDNRALIEQIAQQLPCQVGGGIGSIDRAREMLGAGARRVIIGSALFNSSGVVEKNDEHGLVRYDFARELAAAVGIERLVFSVDTREGRIAIKGWKQQVDLTPETAMAALEPHCDAFLYTHIDREGTMQGFPLDVARKLRDVTSRQLIVAGGIREQEEIDALSAMGVDAVAGMAVYLGRLVV
ncbi:MAG TPA: HisA/HisF-related TIM barrel protein [Acidobacteriaceae bacterium]|jgi:phosphoribosylformimino-5-aminoimidazole carboxamide ribotide isomerase